VIIKSIVIVSILSFGISAAADETIQEKAETNLNQVTDSVKRVYRNNEVRLCEMIDGEKNCLTKKVINNARNVADRLATEAEEIKNKID
jgi:L-2-hydroxyglutarate oxidase LhgO